MFSGNAHTLPLVALVGSRLRVRVTVTDTEIRVRGALRDAYLSDTRSPRGAVHILAVKTNSVEEMKDLYDSKVGDITKNEADFLNSPSVTNNKDDKVVKSEKEDETDTGDSLPVRYYFVAFV